MANDGKIYITISDTRGGSGKGVGDEKETEKKESTATKFARHKFFNFIESEAKSIVTYSINNIGNFTGNYQAQRDMQSAMSAVSFAIGLGTAIAVGAKTGGPWGAAIAATVYVGEKAISTGMQINNEMLENRKLNRNIAIMRERLGLEGLTNGSRTGGY